jgi:hypothetical protein
MKHGDKKQKTAKAITKASGKKASASSRPTGGSKPKKGAAAAIVKGPAKSGSAAAKSGAEASVKRKASVSPDEELIFSNPLVGAAFKRAVKKYPVALKRLVD